MPDRPDPLDMMRSRVEVVRRTPNRDCETLNPVAVCMRLSGIWSLLGGSGAPTPGPFCLGGAAQELMLRDER